MLKRIAVALAIGVTAGAASAQELSGVLKKMKDTGAITISYRDSSTPFSYIDEKAQPVGYALDICLRVAEAVKSELKLAKLDVKLVPVTSATRIPLIANGTIDLECGSTTNNVDRQKQVAFSNTYFLTAARFAAKKTSGFKSINDLKGKTVVSTSGTTNIRQLIDANKERQLGINVVAVKDHAEGLLMVETDRAAALVLDDVVLAALIASSKDPSAFVISQDAISLAEPYAPMIVKDDPQFKAAIDRATAKLYKSADMLAIYDKWFTKPIPPRGANLQLPLDPVLKRAFEKPSDSPDPASYGS